jgi:hypothetical protein
VIHLVADGLGEQRGHRKLMSSRPQFDDEELRRGLWTVSEKPAAARFPV